MSKDSFSGISYFSFNLVSQAPNFITELFLVGLLLFWILDEVNWYVISSSLTVISSPSINIYSTTLLKESFFIISLKFSKFL